MGFKLVRVDATEPCKIPLAVGTHCIGRGKFLDCRDHRVSRNHGQLEVTNDTVHLKALHRNPCFFRRKGTQKTNILSQNEDIELSNGDQFGLVPDCYWYELIYCIENLVLMSGNHTHEQVKVEKSTGDEPSASGSSGNGSQSDIENTERVLPSISQKTLPTFMDTQVNPDTPTTSPYKRSHSKESTETGIKKFKIEPQSPGINNEKQNVNEGSQDSGTTIEEVSHEGIKDTNENVSDNEKQLATTTADIQTDSCTQDTADAIIQTEETEPVQNVKTQAVQTIKTEPVETVKTEPNNQVDVKPGPSNDQPGDAAAAANPAAGDDSAAAQHAPAPAPAAAPPAPARPREKCMYGAQCYRVNPAHKAQFSHPGDADWAARVPCRWGAACRDIRPAHWRDYDHPPRPHRDRDQPRRNPHGIRVVQRHGNIFYINAHSVHFYDDHFRVQDSDGESVDYDYEF